jgi:hypothetical protein
MEPLEAELDSLCASAESVAGSKTTATKVLMWAKPAIYAWPIILAVIAAILNKYTPITVMSSDNIRVLSVITLGPPFIFWATGALASKRLARLQRKLEEAIKKRAELLERIKKELPMTTALRLLMKFDPTGDHRVSTTTHPPSR